MRLGDKFIALSVGKTIDGLCTNISISLNLTVLEFELICKSVLTLTLAYRTNEPSSKVTTLGVFIPTVIKDL